MATANTRKLARAMLAPSVVILFIWMIVPLVLTLWYSFQSYNLLNPVNNGFAGLSNYTYFLTDPSFVEAFLNTLVLTVSVLVPGITGMQIVGILIGGSVLAAAIAVSAASAVSSRTSITPPRDPNRDFWRMPPLEQLPPARLSTLERVWLIVLRTTSSLPAVLCRSGLSRWQLAAQNEPAGAFSNRRRSLIGISINVNTAKCETFAKRKESGADSSKSR